ncbi:MAG: glycosyltransferase family 2 protein [Candidatus Krumholzibacteriia bacterium]
MSKPRLSLCVIVRDEETMLPGFLERVAGLWDELVAVDTGSGDGTVALLEAAGARVVHHPWSDDFAAARNASLAPATGDWILFLDADERVTPELVVEIRSLLGDDRAGAATVVMRNELPGGHRRESALLRLFRRDPAVRFRHRIHEDVCEDVQAMLARTDRRLVALRGAVDHLGYVQEVAAAREKKERDRRLLRRALDDDPRDLYSAFKLLELARFWDDRALWREAALLAAPRLEAAGGELARAPWGGELLALAAEGLHDDPRTALAYLRAHARRVRATPPLLLRRAILHEACRDAAAARADFEACLAWNARDAGVGPVENGWPDRQQVSVRPRLGLCRLAAADGDLTAAHVHAEAALAEAPRDREALLAVLAFAGLDGGAAAVLARADELARAHGRSDELDLACGERLMELGSWREAAARLRRAAGSPPAGAAALPLAHALLGGGEAAAAAQVCGSLLADQPEAALGLATCALALGRDVDLQVDLDPDRAAEVLRRFVRTLWRSRRTDLMERFADGLPALLPAFPWLPAFLREETRRLVAGSTRP